MQPHLLLHTAILSSLILTPIAATLRPEAPHKTHRDNQIPIADSEDSIAQGANSPVSSAPVEPQIVDIMPPISGDTPSDSSDPSSSVMISDVIGKTRSINIFAGFTRDIDTVSSRLDDQSLKSTILCPLNSALQALPRKPWEDPKDYNSMGSNAYAGAQGEDRAHRNLRRFVESHVVAESPWKAGEKVKTLGGGEVWWEQREGGKVVMPGEIAVEGVQEKVRNGEVWIIKGVVNYTE